jgi:hypothetical protein
MAMELDAARVVVAAARVDVNDGLATQCMRDALDRHDHLVGSDDRHRAPSPWSEIPDGGEDPAY